MPKTAHQLEVKKVLSPALTPPLPLSLPRALPWVNMLLAGVLQQAAQIGVAQGGGLAPARRRHLL